MAALRNTKHERIARLLAEGANQTAAYVASYGGTRETAASSCARLLRHPVSGPLITMRVQELRDRLSRAIGETIEDITTSRPLTRDWVLEELRLTVERAKKGNQNSVVNKSLELLGKELGMFVDRSDVTMSLDQLTLDDLRKLATELEKDPDVQRLRAEQPKPGLMN